jgi:transposase
LRSLGRRWLYLHAEIIELDTQIRSLVRHTIPTLITRPGIGIHSAAQLLITAGGNPSRLHSDAAFAALCGASPVQASSGQRQRHRLNRGGDRAANHALWTIANNRLIHDLRFPPMAGHRVMRLVCRVGCVGDGIAVPIPVGCGRPGRSAAWSGCTS